MCWKSLATITATFLILDGIYFFVNNSFFKKTVQAVQKSPVNPRYIAAAITYVFLVAIEYYFIIMQKRKAKDAFLLGMGIYGVYELTNYATLTNWPLYLVLMDTLWGGVLFASATCMVLYGFKV